MSTHTSQAENQLRVCRVFFAFVLASKRLDQGEALSVLPDMVQLELGQVQLPMAGKAGESRFHEMGPT